MAMRGGEFLEIEELRNHQRLFVARNVLVSAFARNLGANGEIVAGDLEGHVVRIDAGKRNVNAPAVIRRVYLERLGRTGRGGAGRQIAPELVEEAIHFTLKVGALQAQDLACLHRRRRGQNKSSSNDAKNSSTLAPKPLNVLVVRDIALSVDEIAALGVRRISLGGALARRGPASCTPP